MSQRSGQEQGGIREREKERWGEKESSRNPPFTNTIRHNWTECTAEEEDITETGIIFLLLPAVTNKRLF